MKLSKYSKKFIRAHLKTQNSYFEIFLKVIFRKIKMSIRFIKNIIFYFKVRKYKNIKKIIYTITPPSSLKNVGDHAQVIAIKKWFMDNFNEYLILEFNKNEVYKYLYYIKKIVNEDDLIFLHSGGNLGDRGLWSENARRLIIKNFPKSKIISLPQTIFFSDTQKGVKELEVTKRIYNNHKDLTIIARDEHSLRLAKDYFPKCKAIACPDFVLYLTHCDNISEERKNILLCLRNDSESIIDENLKGKIKKWIGDLGEDCQEYDTTLDRNIPKENREEELNIALNLFRKHKLVITDRFHGVIFSVITKTPCIALKTVDHKLTESIKWFKDLNYIFYTKNYEQLPEIMNKALGIYKFKDISWKKLYFDDLRSKIFSNNL